MSVTYELIFRPLHQKNGNSSDGERTQPSYLSEEKKMQDEYDKVFNQDFQDRTEYRLRTKITNLPEGSLRVFPRGEFNETFTLITDKYEAINENLVQIHLFLSFWEFSHVGLKRFHSYLNSNKKWIKGKY